MSSRILLLDEYQELDDMLLETMQCANADCSVLVLQDIPFLPPNMMSIYEYYINKYETNVYKMKDLFYAFLDIPEVWVVRAEGVNGAIFKEGEKMATVYFKEPLEKRNVQRIEWRGEAKGPYKIDYYNRYGFVYSTAFISADGTVQSKSYYTSEHKEVINVNCSNGVVTLFENGHVICLLSSIEEFEKKIMREVIVGKKQIVLTTNRQAKMMMELNDYSSSNMIMVLYNKQGVEECQVKHFHHQLQCPMIVMNNYNTEKCHVENARNEFRLCYSVADYPKVKGSSDALILTAMDELFGIEQLIACMPEITFHIAAKTLVSQKLSEMSEIRNVRIYPAIKEEKLQQLYEECDFYLDINAGREVDNAVIRASINNMLILGYNFSLHNRHYLLDECIFEIGEEVEFAHKINCLIKNKGELEKLTAKQQEKIKASIRHVEG